MTPAHPIAPRTPLNAIVLLAAVVVLLSAVGTAIAAGLSTPPVWFLVMFELVVAATAVFGILLGRGRYAEGRGLALLCVAGAVAACSVGGFLAANFALMGVSLKPWLLGRFGAAAVFAAVAAWTVLSRRPALSLPRFLKGAAWLAAATLLAAGASKFSGALANTPIAVQIAAGLAGTVAFLVFLAAGVHLTVRSFEHGRLDHADHRPVPAPAAPSV